MKHKIVAIIPARFASTRFPGKPLEKIAGKTMIRRVYDRVKKISEIADVVVATDDEQIFKHVAGFGGKVVMTSDTHQSGTDRCFEALKYLKTKYDFVLNIQGDEPFIMPQQIKTVIETLENNKSGLATLKKKIEGSDEILDPNTVKVVTDKNGYALYFSRHPIPYMRGYKKELWYNVQTYYKHIGIYGYSVATLTAITKLKPSSLELAESLEQLRWLENGLSIKVAETEYASYGVDTPEDLIKVEKMYKNKLIK